ncbi:MAG TPA: glycosyltransferase family A protein [Anaerolineales bacterium]
MTDIFCSTIIPTIARSTLEQSVRSVLEQSFSQASFEVIVVNDSGQPLAEEAWLRSEGVQVIRTDHLERSTARNTGAAIAQGKYLHFLDDDDCLLPGALQAFWALAQSSQADWLYGSSQLVDRHETPLIDLYPGMGGACFIQVMAGEWIPLQASLIRTDAFLAVGGFTPGMHATEDVDLCRRIALRGDLAFSQELVARISMGRENSSTDVSRASEFSRRAREKILNEPGVFNRMRFSAESSDWLGRITRIYLTSALWNVRHRRGFTAASRMMYGAASLLLAGRSLFSARYWQAVARTYQSETFAHGFQKSAPVVIPKSHIPE